MKKVILTQEQADSIKMWVDKTQLLKAKIVGLLNHGEDEPIAEMDVETLAKALYIGYEVEPEFKEGQWVALDDYASSPIIAKILGIDVEGDGRIRLDWSDHCWWDEERIRHATASEIAEEKERRLWKKHGREVWEIKQGDLLNGIDSDEFYEVINKDEGFHTLYFINSEWWHLRAIKANFRIACFAEQRLDLEESE